MKGFLILFVVMVCCWACSRKQNVKFLQLNIWQEGTMVKGGYDALVNELVVLMLILSC